MLTTTKEQKNLSVKIPTINNLAIFGMGYVGCVSAACLADNGLTITGMDVNKAKTDALSKGKSPIYEPQLEELLTKGVKDQKLKTADTVQAAIKNSEACFICVGTPSLENGNLNMEFVLRVTEELAKALKEANKPFILIYRSTLQPGTTENKILPLLRSTLGEAVGRSIHVVVLPEFLREGTAIKDFFSPAKTVIGSDSEKVADEVLKIFRGKTGSISKTDVKIAEVIKVVNNTFHALKVAFGNEIGTLCQAFGIDSHKLMKIFLEDTQLNISPKYFIPGKPFGGSCLPKDLRAVKRVSLEKNLNLPVINNILESNRVRTEDILKRITKAGVKKIGFLGLSFKENTDDLRESPAVDLIEQLIGKGFKLQIFDPQITYSYLVGSNKEYLNKHIPHITELLAHNVQEFVKDVEFLVITNDHPEFRKLAQSLGRKVSVLDLVGLKEFKENERIQYEGLFW